LASSSSRRRRSRVVSVNAPKMRISSEADESGGIKGKCSGTVNGVNCKLLSTSVPLPCEPVSIIPCFRRLCDCGLMIAFLARGRGL